MIWKWKGFIYGKEKLRIYKGMLIWARRETPFSTTSDVEAQQKGIKAEKLDLWESGEELPSINETKKLAALYKVPFACFSGFRY